MTEATLESVAARIDELFARLDAPSQRFLTVEQAAAYAGVSEESIRRLLSADALTALRPVRGRIVIDRQQLDAYVLGTNGRLRKGRGIRR